MLHGIQRNPEHNFYNVYTKEAPKVVPIAPAPEKKYLSMDMQKKYTSKSNPYTGPQAASIARRNARERNRVKQVNDGFNALRKRLPPTVIAALSGGSRRGSGKKLSKVDTLRMVVEYIRYMETIIDESDAALGIVKKPATVDTSFELEDEAFCENSPYSEPVLSPADSDSSSGVSSGVSAYSSAQSYFPVSYQSEQVSPMDESELLDAISWWQQK